MMPPQTPYMTPPPTEMKPETQPPVMQRPVSPEYNEQFIESLAQRLMPRLMPEIMYNLRSLDPTRAHNRAVGLSFALAIVSIGVMIPLTAIILGILVTAVGGGIAPALIGISIVGLVILLINVMYNYWLFNDKSTHA
jgi:hypothetical protein